MDILFLYGHVAILLRRLYRHEIHRAGINCHALATVLAEVYDEATATHGWVLGYDFEAEEGLRYQHSWLSVGEGWIIDSKPIHCITTAPLLVDTKGVTVAGHFYLEGMNTRLRKSVRAEKTKRGARALRRGITKINEEDPITDEEVLGLLMKGQIE